MWIKKLEETEPFFAGDNTFLRELLHPAKDAAGAGLPFSLAYAELAPGTASLRHRLVQSAEVYFIIDGSGTIEVNGQSRTLASGDTALVLPNASQSLRNEGAEVLKFLCVVAPAWRLEDEEIEEP